MVKLCGCFTIIVRMLPCFFCICHDGKSLPDAFGCFGCVLFIKNVRVCVDGGKRKKKPKVVDIYTCGLEIRGIFLLCR